MQIKVGEISVDYLIKGHGSPILLLHGWSKNKDSYCHLVDLIPKKFRIIVPDLPGFGASNLPCLPWGVRDYSQFVLDFLKQLKVQKCIVIGHSFGGRVAIKVASEYPEVVEKLILIDSSGIERKSLLVKSLGKFSPIIPKIIKDFLSPIFGSKDYRVTKGVMRETLKKVVGENLEKELPRIKIPTLIIWGEEDRTTPLWQGKLMHQLIKSSKLAIVPSQNHGLPYRNPQETASIIFEFLK